MGNLALYIYVHVLEVKHSCMFVCWLSTIFNAKLGC